MDDLSDLEKTREYRPQPSRRLPEAGGSPANEVPSMGPLALDVALADLQRAARAGVPRLGTPLPSSREVDESRASRRANAWTVGGLALLAVTMIAVAVVGRGALAPAMPTPVGHAAGGSAPAAPSDPYVSRAVPALTGDVPEVDVASLPHPPFGTVVGSPEHRLWVDGHLTPWRVRLRCGLHTVKVGSAGAPRVVDVPCGSEVNVSP
jgi:hypothetical protein